MRIIFSSYIDYNAAKGLALSTISIGEPVDELDENGLPTGRYIIDHGFTDEQIVELNSHSIYTE